MIKLTTKEKEFLKDLQYRGVGMYLWCPSGGCQDVDESEISDWISEPSKFWAKMEEKKYGRTNQVSTSKTKD